MFKLPRTATAPFCPSEVRGSIAAEPGASKWKRLARTAGPGLLVAVGYMDPGNWATDIEAGSVFGHSLLFVVLLAFCSFYSRINIGVRHVLVLYPLLATGAAVTVTRLWRAARAGALGRGGALVRAALSMLLAWHGIGLARSWPDFLAYFNETVAEPRAVLIDSDLDWGQDFKRLTQRLRALEVPSVSLAYLGTADLAREPLPPYTLLTPDQHASGWIAVTALARAHAPRQFSWLDAYVPRERVGRSIDLYFVPPAPP